jgi:SNF2 family DNA or RNA helicase
VLDLVGRERIVPRILHTPAGTEARFAIALGHPEDARRVADLARSMPPAAHAVPVNGRGMTTSHSDKATRGSDGARGSRARGSSRSAEVWAPEALLRLFLDATADALVRTAAKALFKDPAKVLSGHREKALLARARSTRRSPAEWEHCFVAALSGDDARFAPTGFQERRLLNDLQTWARAGLGVERDVPRLCLRLDLPDHNVGGSVARTRLPSFPLRFFLQAAHDPSLLAPAADVLAGNARFARRFASSSREAEEILLRSLATAARLFAPVERALRDARPESVLLDTDEAWTFIAEGAAALAEAGIGVILPAELTRSGQRRLRMRMRIGGSQRPASASAGENGLSLDAVTSFRWEAELAGETLSERELQALANLKSSLVRYRGQWVAVDSAELREAQRLLAEGRGTVTTFEALAAALGEETRRADVSLPIEVVAEGGLAKAIARLRDPESAGAASAAGTPVPVEFHGVLRPYQSRGLDWLARMADLGLGACLADDMGLGKTIQLLALLLHRRTGARDGERPNLLVCPTSVVGNWEYEIGRFAPSLPVIRHYGAERARSAAQFDSAPAGAVVITTYGLLRRDAEVLSGVHWSVAALDEAQNIKSPASRTARAARTLHAGFRVALTGTPVENHLGELWSISEFLNPRLLGPLETFRRDVAVPIERHGREDVAARLRRVIGPFILRRLKSDPGVIRDLPPKQEMKVLCSLTREQASLYQAAVDEAMRRIESSEGIQRRGLVLALITALKQICNHPAQFLGENGRLAGRSGKLQRLGEMLEEVVESGDRALVFTQYREMGERLVSELERLFGRDVPFLHGGVARKARDEMVRRFQEGTKEPRIFVLSVKAGGTGLNLTAANHVFHFDRWWNPAVEDQATDRAYRIGQKRTVQVHKMLCAGTVEDKIDRMLERKRDLASRIVGQGEQWITELDDGALRELFSLAPGAAQAGEDADP